MHTKEAITEKLQTGKQASLLIGKELAKEFENDIKFNLKYNEHMEKFFISLRDDTSKYINSTKEIEPGQKVTICEGGSIELNVDCLGWDTRADTYLVHFKAVGGAIEVLQYEGRRTTKANDIATLTKRTLGNIYRCNNKTVACHIMASLSIHTAREIFCLITKTQRLQVVKAVK